MMENLKCHVIIFLLFARFAFCSKCDCKLVEILRNIVQKEIMEREILESRVDMLESKFGSGIINDANTSETSSDKAILERLSVIETMIEQFNTIMKENEMERHNGARHNTALTNAWKIHKLDFTLVKEDIHKSLSDNKKSVYDVARDVDKRMEVVEFKVDQLINHTSSMVKNQLKNVENRFEVINSELNTTFDDYTTQQNKDFAIVKEDIQKSISDNKKSFQDLTREVEKYKDNVEIKTEQLINQTSSTVTKQVKIFEDRFELIRFGLNMKLDQYTTQMNKDFAVFTNNTDRTLHGMKAEVLIDECARNPCMNGATCITGIKSYSCVCLAGYQGTNCHIALYDCKAIRDSGNTANGIYTVYRKSSRLPIQLYCDMQTDGGGWTVFQNRFNGLLDYNRNLTDYENGFGNLKGEFWIGLKFVQEMLLLGPTELRLDVSAIDSTTFYSVFQNFSLGSDSKYILNIGARSGSLPNRPDRTLAQHNGRCFSTYDRDCTDSKCAERYKGGWWFKECFVDGVYLNGVYTDTYGISHFGFKAPSYTSKQLPSSKMMFRRV